jgi:penicillin-binding protein A
MRRRRRRRPSRWRRERQQAVMNQSLRHVMVVLLGCFCLLFAQLNRIQIFEAHSLQENGANTRTVQRQFNQPRGQILTRDGVVVARSELTPGQRFARQRVYPEGDLYAHSVGYLSFNLGADGVEKVFNNELTGHTPALELANLTSLLDPDPDGGSVTLTLDDRLQRVARDQLGNRPGSVVAMDPRTGAILAMWSYPSFDPNTLATNDGAAANAAYKELLDASGNPLRPKAYRDRQFPGSTFKLITASAALESGAATLDQPVFEATSEYTPPLTNKPITNFSGGPCGGDLTTILARSCNTPFAKLATETLGPLVMVNQANAAGFNTELPFDLPGSAVSNFPTDYGKRIQAPTDAIPAGIYENTPKLAQASIGQNDVQASPLMMALVAAGVANNGIIVKPHLLAEVRDSSGRVVRTRGEEDWRQSMRADNARVLQQAMIQAADRGRTATVNGLRVGVKTGTAQLGTDPPRSHAWIVGFAGRPDGANELVVSVLVEGQEGSVDQTGGAVAGPIAKALVSDWFNR